MSAGRFGTRRALCHREPKAGQHTLRITIHEDREPIEITLEGRVAGPWVAELNRVWAETAPRLATRKLSLDLRNVTYADAGGKQVLRNIYAQTHPELVTSTPLTQYLAEEIRANATRRNEETDNADHS